MNESLGQRLQRLRNAAGKSQAALAKLCGWSSQSRVGNYESGTREPTLGDIELMAKALGVPYGVLLIGEDFEASRMPTNEQSNVEMAEQPTRMYRYPVVSEVAAGAWAEVVEPYPNGYSDRYEATDYKAKGPAFWLEVVGDSMTAPSGTSVPEGMLILVDTGVEARPGKLVVAKVPSSNKATFKKLIEDAGRLYLKPLNPDFKMMPCTDDCKIIGVAVRVTGFL
ncbi:Prophage PssSM-03, putative phage repressor [Pseudomonas cannabina pv. alisalensis]|uniref:Helix-turn-helix domain-containing protein n=2 Tax=Pseudomonas cannabina TaxID=86840 RepID=A0ABS1XFB5_PSEC1|nr:S24 family peptidase [Pseudomonas cannabina]KPW26629.1 Prophage PssSM-03, putative phage repressor [Pseudomonas cannabina pv. alisalensis]MBM0140172.1 helix-turn-helix domain-containing protein [Pseudomonas cannabina pv. alisalensis]RMN77591.1 Phage repressor protein, Serine peptidase, MEROPS family S24 [Pseudomonas cannabina pv. alisalensis]RMO05621.1 Prophage PssSM-03, putative phage repressor [Pseudomonas cannabina]